MRRRASAAACPEEAEAASRANGEKMSENAAIEKEGHDEPGAWKAAVRTSALRAGAWRDRYEGRLRRNSRRRRRPDPPRAALVFGRRRRRRRACVPRRRVIGVACWPPTSRLCLRGTSTHYVRDGSRVTKLRARRAAGGCRQRVTAAALASTAPPSSSHVFELWNASAHAARRPAYGRSRQRVPAAAAPPGCVNTIDPTTRDSQRRSQVAVADALRRRRERAAAEEVGARLQREVRRLEVVVVGDLDAHQVAQRVGLAAAVDRGRAVRTRRQNCAAELRRLIAGSPTPRG